MYHDTNEVKVIQKFLFTIEVHDEIYCLLHLPLTYCRTKYNFFQERLDYVLKNC